MAPHLGKKFFYLNGEEKPIDYNAPYPLPSWPPLESRKASCATWVSRMSVTTMTVPCGRCLTCPSASCQTRVPSRPRAALRYRRSGCSQDDSAVSTVKKSPSPACRACGKRASNAAKTCKATLSGVPARTRPRAANLANFATYPGILHISASFRRVLPHICAFISAEKCGVICLFD